MALPTKGVPTVECHSCKISDSIAQAMESFGETIPDAVREPLQNACYACSHNCRNCRTRVNPGLSPAMLGFLPEEVRKRLAPDLLISRMTKRRSISAYRRKQELGRVISSCEGAASRDTRNEPSDPSAFDLELEAQLKAGAWSTLPSFDVADPPGVCCAKAELAYLLTRFCLKCNRSCDDNPSNKGAVFVSKDADSDSPHPDDQLEDWLLSRKIEGEADTGGCTLLPDEIETAFRIQTAGFMDLSLFDKLLLAVITTRKPGRRTKNYCLTDFAKLRWIEDPGLLQGLSQYGLRMVADGQGVSKQSAHSRFRRMVRDVPFLAGLSFSS